MKIMLNGQQKELSQSADLQSIIDQLCKDSQNIIAEVNGDIIKRPQWCKRTLQEGDSVELLNFVGGGS